MKRLETEGWTVKAVKSVEHNKGLSYSGNLYRGTKKVATFVEHGCGGPMSIEYFDDDAKADFLLLSNFVHGDDHTEADAVMVAELLIAEMVDQYEYIKRIRRDRKKKTYFSVEEHGDVTEFVIDAPYSKCVVDMILENKGDITIANEEFNIYPDGVNRVNRDKTKDNK